MSTEFWNERYAGSEYAYGTEPSDFLRDRLQSLTPGTVLFPAEGEGRNAVHAARMGWKVTAFDQSTEGRRKALALAAQHNVEIDYRTESLEHFPYTSFSFDAAVSIFVHLPPSFRPQFHRSLVNALSPGGILLLEAFSKEQLQYSSGGPKDAAQLYSVDELYGDLEGLDIISLQQETVQLNEGPFHSGPASVVRCVARKGL